MFIILPIILLFVVIPLIIKSVKKRKEVNWYQNNIHSMTNDHYQSIYEKAQAAAACESGYQKNNAVIEIEQKKMKYEQDVFEQKNGIQNTKISSSRIETKTNSPFFAERVMYSIANKRFEEYNDSLDEKIYRKNEAAKKLRTLLENNCSEPLTEEEYHALITEDHSHSTDELYSCLSLSEGSVTIDKAAGVAKLNVSITPDKAKLAALCGSEDAVIDGSLKAEITTENGNAVGTVYLLFPVAGSSEFSSKSFLITGICPAPPKVKAPFSINYSAMHLWTVQISA